MKNIIAFCFICFLSGNNLHAQTTAPPANLWYVWIDTEVEINGKISRVISNQPFEITCCVKSPKYRKLLKKTEKWIQQELKTKSNGDNVLKKIQDQSLAREMIKRSITTQDDSKSVIRVEYEATCK